MRAKERNINLEILRIICMLQIVTLHFLGRGGGIRTDKFWYN